MADRGLIEKVAFLEQRVAKLELTTSALGMLLEHLAPAEVAKMKAAVDIAMGEREREVFGDAVRPM